MHFRSQRDPNGEQENSDYHVISKHYFVRQKISCFPRALGNIYVASSLRSWIQKKLRIPAPICGQIFGRPAATRRKKSTQNHLLKPCIIPPGLEIWGLPVSRI